MINRTPKAVVLKLSNLAHDDSELQARNVSGLAHTSKLDEKIYVEYANNIEELPYQAQGILAQLKNTTVEKLLLQLECLPVGIDKEHQTKGKRLVLG